MDEEDGGGDRVECEDVEVEEVDVEEQEVKEDVEKDVRMVGGGGRSRGK